MHTCNARLSHVCQLARTPAQGELTPCAMSLETFIRLTCKQYSALMFTCRCGFGVGVHQELDMSISYQSPSRIRERYTNAVSAICTECMTTPYVYAYVYAFAYVYVYAFHLHMSVYMHLDMSVCIPVCIHLWMDG